nr:RNA-directed DNA polymerase, eukaryota [Tanacetum cinerariifolium]
KRFAFVRFIRVFNLDRLIKNLCTIWIGRLRLHANTVKYQREPRSNVSQSNKLYEGSAKNTFEAVLKTGTVNPILSATSSLAIVLDDSCLIERDFTCSLMRKIKDINAIANLYSIHSNEGFENVNVSYLGGLWVLLETNSVASKEKLIKHVGVGSWFTTLQLACNSFVSDERIVWIFIEGLPIKAFSRNSFVKIVSKWGELTDVEDTKNSSLSFKRSLKLGLLNSLQEENLDSEEEELEGEEEDHFSETKVNDLNHDKDNDFDHVSESSCMRDFNQVYDKVSNVSEQPKPSDDPFGIYRILKRNKETTEAESEGLKFPPGFTPEVVEENVVNNELEKNSQPKSDMPINNEGATTDKRESNCVPKFRAGGSILEVIDEVIKAFSPLVGSTGGILCAWDPSVFIKENITISDSFVTVRGTWTPSFANLLVISVYAPQDMFERRMLWDYFGNLIDNWDGECVLLGDFNEVRSEQERYGTTFNHQGAYAFNIFINMAGLVDLPLEGSSYTWAHKSASKMSKLDRFLIFDGLLSLFSSLSALCLDRSLSDHRPILLRELNVDYGRGKVDLVNERYKLLKELQDLNFSYSLDMAQKAKIYWSIKGDENCERKTRKGQNQNKTRQNQDQTGSVENPGNVKVQSQSRKQKKRRKYRQRDQIGIQINKSPRGIFINQAKYAQEILIKHGMTSCDIIGTPMATKHLDADFSGTPVDQTKYQNSDHAGCLNSRKSTSGGIQFLGGDKLVSWSSKKQDCTSMSSIEAEYVALSACCAQVLWMRTQLTYYGFMYCDSKAAIAISCNPVQHSRTKHIDVKEKQVKDKIETKTGQNQDQTGSVEKPGNVKVQSQSRKQKKRRKYRLKGLNWRVDWSDKVNQVIWIMGEREIRHRLSSLSQIQIPGKVEQFQNDDLERTVTYEEIKRAVWDCGINKSPGPDGFTFEFFRRYWNVIDIDVVDGRVAILLFNMYKIIAKILANRLSMVISDLVSDVQSAFVSNRQILNGLFIFNELISWCKHKNIKAMIFKVDFEKAFDSVRWDYLDDVLNKFGFRVK